MFELAAIGGDLRLSVDADNGVLAKNERHIYSLYLASPLSSLKTSLSLTP